MRAEVIPEALTGESLYSLAGRLGRVNGYRAELTCRLLLGSSAEFRVADAEINLSRFVTATQSLYGNSIELLQKYTVFPFRNMTASRLLHADYSSKSGTLLLNSKFNLAELSNYEEHLWRWCPECLERDKASIGFTYWRVKHQLPGVFVCSDHRTTLIEVTIPFRRRQTAFFFPDSLPLDIKQLNLCPQNLNYDLANKLCSISEGILNCKDLNINHAAFRQTIKQGLSIKGWTTKAGLIHKKTSIAFARFYEPLKGINEILVITQSHIFEKHSKTLFNNHEITLKKPLLIPMLILWLYGEWQLFKNAYEWETCMLTEAEFLCASPNKKRTLSNELFRNICNSFILENPQLLRKDFYKLHPRPYAWLKKYDNEWLEKILPSPSIHKSRQFQLFKE